jgi:hypothetical protein
MEHPLSFPSYLSLRQPVQPRRATQLARRAKPHSSAAWAQCECYFSLQASGGSYSNRLFSPVLSQKRGVGLYIPVDRVVAGKPVTTFLVLRGHLQNKTLTLVND